MGELTLVERWELLRDWSKSLATKTENALSEIKAAPTPEGKSPARVASWQYQEAREAFVEVENALKMVREYLDAAGEPVKPTDN